MKGGTSMPSNLTYKLVLDILELISFKKSSLTQTELFLRTSKKHKHVELLKIDIDLTIHETNDLQGMLKR